MPEFNDINEIREGQKESRLDIILDEDATKKLLTINLDGRLDIFTYRELARKLEAALDRTPDLRVVVNFEKVSFVASSGWSVFIATRSKLRRSGGTIVFASMNEELARVYGAMRMPELVKVFPTAEEAVASITSGV